MRSLTARLVVTVVALVLLVCVLIGTVTSLALRNSLMDRLDRDLVQLSQRPRFELGGASGAPDGVPDGGRRGPSATPNVPPGSLVALVRADGTSAGYVGSFDNTADTASTADLKAARAITPDARPHTVTLPDQGRYRVIATTLVLTNTGENVTLITGMSTAEVDETMRNLVFWEALLTLLGVSAAAAGGIFLVRRQLGPLRDVAATAHAVSELPLATGEVEVAERVPARLTDERTEVGQVGAALNTLLEHVESALSSRHRSEQQVRQFVADASHELRTPLTTIRGYTELARHRPEAVPVALGKVEEESGRMTSLVEDLLLLARLDQGRPLAREDVDLTRLLLEAVDDARVVSPDHAWQLTLPPELPAGADTDDATVHVTGDELRLHQVVSNLLTNARRYTPAGTTVTVRLRPDGFDVHDDGPGFPPDLVPHAFDRFTRGDEARQRDGGAGLGLSLVEAIVASHGGSVSLTSEPGDTTIAVRLPNVGGVDTEGLAAAAT